ncbi:MAG: hypothetical protein AAF827_22815, partial [Cyanobacteria bacterium P01_D01_bin.6]
MVLLTLFLIPALMLSDYYLTLIGERLRQQSESRRLVRLESYELNPLFRKDVARLRWFNWRHLAATAGITALMVFLAYGYVLEVSPVPFLGILGFYAVLFGVIIGRHLQSILAFADTLKQPQVDVETAQKPIISLEDTLKLTQGSNISLLPPFGLCALISRSEFMVGGFGGILMLILMNFIWLKQH